jgi:thiol-disulfide isomerase/thioredoxin
MAGNMEFRLASLAAIAAVLLLSKPLPAQELGIPVGTRAPSALVTTLDGKPVDIGSWVGKVPMVIEFWASWCSSCKELESAFAEMERKYGSRLKFMGVAVSVSQSPERVKAYTTKYKYRHETFFDTDGKATEAYDVPGTSYVVVVNRKGTVVYTGIGGRQALEPAILRALAD